MIHAQKRIPELDGIRGLAILMVLVCHYIQIPLQSVPGSLPKYAAKLLSLTWSGVDLFFVLSGFLICGILLDNKESSTFFRTFYVRRTTRIFPLYFALLVIFVFARSTLSIPWLFENAAPLWSYATFTQNIVVALKGLMGEQTNFWLGLTWSLAIEEQFYLILPFVVFFVSRRSLLLMFCCGIIGAVVLRIFSPGDHAYVLTPWRADSLLSGAAFAVLVRSPSFASWIARNRRMLVFAFFVLLAGAAAMTAKPWAPWAKNHLWLALLYSVFLLVVLTQMFPVLNRILVSRVLVWMGTISYGVYLLHPPVAALLHWYISGKTAPQFRTTTDIMVTVLAIIVTLGLATLSFRHFETPFLKLGQKFKYAPARTAPAVSRADPVSTLDVTS